MNIRQTLKRTLFRWPALIGLVTLSSALAQAQTTEFGFSQTRPRLVVLLHGVTPKPTEDPDAKIGWPGHARYYWGFNFIKGLQGRMDEAKMQVITPRVGGSMTFKTTGIEDWYPVNVPTYALDLAPICFPVSWWTSLPADITTNTQTIKDYIRIMTKNQGANATMVMINNRDGSKHLMPQLAEAIEEIYYSYTTAFGHLPEADQPQMYLVGHSFGGIIARGILANPSAPDLYGNYLSASQRAKADYLRRRVVLVQTLSAPHEGTLISDPAGDVARYIQTYGYSIIYSFLAATNGLGSSEELTEAQLKEKTKEYVKLALDNVSGTRDCLGDLWRMKEYNNGILHPGTARRSTGGSLVPIYTSAGRIPGGTYYDRSRSVFYLGGSAWNPISSIDLITGTRPSKEASALNLIEGVLHLDGYGKEGKKPWGSAVNPYGDKVKSPWTGIGPTTPRLPSAGWAPTQTTIETLIKRFLAGAPYLHGQTDGEYDNDGFLGWDSAHALNLTGANWFRVYHPTYYGNVLPWDVDNHGSLMFNPANGAWIHNELVRDAGPYVIAAGARRSSWNSMDFAETPLRGIKLEIVELQDYGDDLDYASGADFWLKVRIGNSETSRYLPEDTSLVKTIQTYTVTNYPGTIIPIRIDMLELDYPDPHDICVLSPKPGQSSLYLYFDTEKNRVIGDVNALGGTTFQIKPIWWGVQNTVWSKIRITRVQ